MLDLLSRRGPEECPVRPGTTRSSHRPRVIRAGWARRERQKTLNWAWLGTAVGLRTLRSGFAQVRPAQRRRREFVGMLIAVGAAACLIAGCSGARHGIGSASPDASPSASPAPAVPLLETAPGFDASREAGVCGTKSRIGVDAAIGAPVIQGLGDGVQAFAMIEASSIPPHVGDQIKVVWRLTGSGTPTFSTDGPDSRKASLLFGPQSHEGSNWNEPGDEWGTGFEFPSPGCWQIAVARGSGSAKIWLAIA